MSYESRYLRSIEGASTPVPPGPDTRHGPGPGVMGAGTLIGNEVYNAAGEDLGSVREIMLDVSDGRICYAVLSFGSILGMGGKLFAVPWSALRLDTDQQRFVLEVTRERLRQAPGFDQDHWPDMADQSWASSIKGYYGTASPAWTEQRGL